MRKTLPILSLFLLTTGCATSSQPEVIVLQQNAEKIELVTFEPDRSKCKFTGDVQGTAKSTNVAEATTNSRNDMKNKALAAGANFVTIDTTTAANAKDYSGRNQVVLTGRGFSCKAL
ncbi:Uncharacterised protein [BD1-7 clade bacterium]|uniref:DUF4156 domain-containing protein n=1 Tax=BD1-7 clade bacterium TaxID=2029982 RepID=A0A5S9QZM1_9GAMM|nr:Uncharacterised protein [BD1-7 clade bacterium]